MTVYSEKNAITLTTGASDLDGDSITLYRINGAVVSAWPQTVPLLQGDALVYQNGLVEFDDGGNASMHPFPGQSAANGEFTFTIWDGSDESPTYTAVVQLNGSTQSSVTVNYGWNEDWDSGLTTGDIYVDPANGSDSNTGSSVEAPKQTLGAAIQAASNGDTILLRGGSYRESVSLNSWQSHSAETIISRYGNEKPVITGAETIGGWAQCTSADHSILGSNFASIYKTTLAKSSYVASGPLGLNLRENGVWMSIATDRADTSELFFGRNKYSYHVADNFNLNESNNIVSIDHPSIFSQYSTAQLQNAQVWVYRNPNETQLCYITNISGGVATISPQPLVQKNTPTPNPNDERYSLINILPAMVRGQWGYQDNGSSITIYCWPNDVNNLAANMTYAARSTGINLASGNNVTLQGVQIVGLGGEGNTGTVCFGSVSATATHKTNITLRNCYFGQISNGTGGYGAVYLAKTSNLLVEDCTFEETQGAFGLFVNSCDNGKVTNVYSHLTSDSLCRFYGCRGFEFSYSLLDNGGNDAHSNAFNFYGNASSGGSDKVLIYGIKVRKAGGYVTWQGASRLYVGMCDIEPNTVPIDRRALKDQNGGNYPTIGVGENCYVWNTLLQPDLAELNSTPNSMDLGQSGVDVRWATYNNIIHGGNISEPYLASNPRSPSVEVERKRNVYSGLVFWQTNQTYGWSMDPTEITSDIPSCFVDGYNGDFTPNPSGPIRTNTGFDMTGRISEMQTHFPNFDFNRDIDGKPINWGGASQIGPYAP